jgi:hypothetical protein
MSAGAFPVTPNRGVRDPFSGAVLGQPSASARTSRSVITGPRADAGEAAAWREALRRSEIGLEAPLGANVEGPDFLTAVRLPNGDIRLIVTDVKTSTVGRFPRPATTVKKEWLPWLNAATRPGRLSLGDPALEAAIRAAYEAGRWEPRQINVDVSPAGGGRMTGF